MSEVRGNRVYNKGDKVTWKKNGLKGIVVDTDKMQVNVSFGNYGKVYFSTGYDMEGLLVFDWKYDPKDDETKQLQRGWSK